MATGVQGLNKPPPQQLLRYPGVQMGGFHHPVPQYAPPQPSYQAHVRPGANSGTIKWYNVAKGFGFIVPTGGGKDVHFSKANMVSETVTAGDPVQFEQKSKDGKTWAIGVSLLRGGAQAAPVAAYYQAVAPRPAYYPTPAAAPAPPLFFPVQQSYAGAKKTGHVKWYNEEKKYGFIIPSSGGTDIHFSQANLVSSSCEQGDFVEYEEQSKSDKTWAVGVTVSAGGPPQPAAAPAYQQVPHGGTKRYREEAPAFEGAPHGYGPEKVARVAYDPYGAPQPVPQYPPASPYGAPAPVGYPAIAPQGYAPQARAPAQQPYSSYY